MLSEKQIEVFIKQLQWNLRASYNSSSCLNNKQRMILKERLYDLVVKPSRKLQDENKRLQEENRWIPVSATSEKLPKHPDFWGKEIFAIIDGKAKCIKYVGYIIGMSHWKPIILPKKDLKGKNYNE